MTSNTTNRTHIIIVNYNSGEWLGRSVLSAVKFSQGMVTVVDNNSHDSSVADAKKGLVEASSVEWLENSKNLGFAAANNQVLELVESEFAVLMNPDCEINKDTLLPMLTAFDTHPGFGLLSNTIYNQDGSIQTTCKRRFPTPLSALGRMLFLNRIFPNNPKFANFDYGDVPSDDVDVELVEAVSGAFMMVRMSALEEVGLLDEGYFMHCEDLDWCKRFQLADWLVGFVPNSHVLHAKGVSSASRPVKVLWTLHKGMLRFFDKFYKEQHSWVLRKLVGLGVILSFVARATLTLTKGIFSRLVER